MCRMWIENTWRILFLLSAVLALTAAHFNDLDDEHELQTLLEDEKFTPEEKRAAFVGMRGGFFFVHS